MTSERLPYRRQLRFETTEMGRVFALPIFDNQRL